jgi:hypothetical protein
LYICINHGDAFSLGNHLGVTKMKRVFRPVETLAIFRIEKGKFLKETDFMKTGPGAKDYKEQANKQANECVF